MDAAQHSQFNAAPQECRDVTALGSWIWVLEPFWTCSFGFYEALHAVPFALAADLPLCPAINIPLPLRPCPVPHQSAQYNTTALTTGTILHGVHCLSRFRLCNRHCRGSSLPRSHSCIEHPICFGSRGHFQRAVRCAGSLLGGIDNGMDGNMAWPVPETVYK